MPTNAQIINYALGNDFRDRIPEATKTNLTDVAAKIMEYKPAKNQFLESIYNKVALTIINGIEFENPFAQYRGENINYGDTVEDIYVDLAKGYDFNPDATDPFTKVPESVTTLYHTINVKVQYQATIEDKILRQAMRNEGGLSRLINQIVEKLRVSSDYDEYINTVKVLSTDNIYGKIVKIGNLSGATANKTDLTKLLKSIKDTSSAMKYMNQDFNKLKTHQITPLKHQVLIMTSKFKDAIDMEVLAGIYNLSKVEMSQKIIEVDEFVDQPNMGCLIVDDRGFRINKALEGGDSIYNPKGGYTNHFYNNWELISWSLYNNAVAIKFEQEAA